MSTWMIVEDEPEIYDLLLMMFEMWGIDGLAFTDGEEAVAWIDDVDKGRFQGELPELALLDIRLPGQINGVDVGARLRKSRVLGNIAVVLTTAHAFSVDRQREMMAQSQADMWVRKPLPKFGELQAQLEDTLRKRRDKVKPAEPTSGPASVPKPTPVPKPPLRSTSRRSGTYTRKKKK